MHETSVVTDALIAAPGAVLALVIVAGVAGQWVAWRIGLPSVLILLLVGLVLGPGFGVVDPDATFGPVLLAGVSLAVALILFEGGLSLDLRTLRGTGTVVRRLVSVGAAVTALVGIVAADLVLGFDPALSMVLGTLLVVTGPTVIGPLLREIRPTGAAGPVLRAEGILIDPIGAVAAIVVFEAVRAGEPGDALSAVFAGVGWSIAVGFGFGIVGAGVLMWLLGRFLLPDALHAPAVVAFTLGAYALSNDLQEEAGLLTVTVLGMALATQRYVSLRHVLEFLEVARSLLIAALFVTLAARLSPEALSQLGWRGPLFAAVLILVARPLTILVSTARTAMPRRERVFLAWMAPRGIVAASVSSVFALRLAEVGVDGAELLVPATFMVVILTIGVYGLTAGPLARRLGLSVRQPQGLLVAGAHPLARELAGAVAAAGFPVVLVDTDRVNVRAARMQGLTTIHGNVLGGVHGNADLSGIGQLLALTGNDEVNLLATQEYARLFGRRNVYTLPSATPKDGMFGRASPHLHGRLLFGDGATFDHLDERMAAGARVKVTSLTETFGIEAFRALNGDDALPLLVLSGRRIVPVVAGDDLPPGVETKLVALVGPPPEPSEPAVEAVDVEGMAGAVRDVAEELHAAAGAVRGVAEDLQGAAGAVRGMAEDLEGAAEEV